MRVTCRHTPALLAARPARIAYQPAAAPDQPSDQPLPPTCCAPQVRYVGGTWRVGGLLVSPWHPQSGRAVAIHPPTCLHANLCRPCGTRVGVHLLPPRLPQALSRAFGDAYLKGNDQFEGVSYYASDSYASGFGERGSPGCVLFTNNQRAGVSH